MDKLFQIQFRDGLNGSFQSVVVDGRKDAAGGINLYGKGYQRIQLVRHFFLLLSVCDITKQQRQDEEEHKRRHGGRGGHGGGGGSGCSHARCCCCRE
mmetsp:Transcript_8686/g.15735  ORF Transcript_8686/g.15735 Transcript_8686/m.15735 type:complete len:97 (-) Transcript_8686:28-318(-)